MQVQQLDYHQECNILLRYKLFLLQPLQTQELCELLLLYVELVYLSLLEIIHTQNFLKVPQHNKLVHHLHKVLKLNLPPLLSYTICYHYLLKLPFLVNPLFFFFEFLDVALLQCIDAQLE